MKSPSDIWSKVLLLMEAEMTATTISTFFDDTEAIHFDGDRLVLYTPGEYKRKMIDPRYLPVVERALHELFSAKIYVELINEEELEQYRNPKKPPPDLFLPGTEEYTFDRFVVGASNRFAFVSAKKVAENPGLSYNPLFIYGQSGLGKTHLLYAIAHSIHLQRPDWKILYTKSETFVNEMIYTLRTQDRYMPSFREKYRNVDVFLMDDVQFVAGKAMSEEELFHTFNTLYDAKKQIVFTCDRPPKEMIRLEERLQTRFEWGLPVDIQPPDYETRVGIIKNKAIARGMNLPDPVLTYVAENITANVRQIEGTVNKILALQELMGASVDVDTTIRAVRDMLKDSAEFLPSPQLIVSEVANFFSIDPDAIRGQGQTKTVAMARNIAMFLIRQMTKLSLQEIGQEFNNRHYSTIISNVKRVESNVKSDPALAEIIRDVTTAINSKL